MTLCPELRRLRDQHGRWLARVARRPREREASRAARLLALWEAEILPHCRAEEDVLLPELARHVSEADAVVVLTLSDHVALRRLARELREADGAGSAAATASLVRRLGEHVSFEERTLLPALQEALGCGRMSSLAVELERHRQPRPARAPATDGGRSR